MRAVAIAAALCLVGAAAVAGPPTLMPPPSQPPPAGAGSPPAAAAPDTLALVLGGSAGTPVPMLRTAPGDTLRFGEPFDVDCDFPAAAAVDPDSLRVRVPWAAVAGRRVVDASDAGAAPPPGYRRVVLSVRVYRPGPLRLSWEGDPPDGPVLAVSGSLGPDAKPLPVRDPMRPAQRWWPLGLALLLAAALVWAALRWRRRRADGAGEIDEPLPPPAWMVAAADLEALLEERMLEKGESRAFLHRLDEALRRFLSRRYRIAALEMTGSEIAAALAARRHPPAARELAVPILERCDALRFAPAASTLEACRGLFAATFDSVESLRIPVCAAFVAPADLAAGNRSWRKVAEAAAAGREAARV